MIGGYNRYAAEFLGALVLVFVLERRGCDGVVSERMGHSAGKYNYRDVDRTEATPARFASKGRGERRRKTRQRIVGG